MHMCVCVCVFFYFSLLTNNNNNKLNVQILYLNEFFIKIKHNINNPNRYNQNAVK